jgi:hypothetical protein
VTYPLDEIRVFARGLVMDGEPLKGSKNNTDYTDKKTDKKDGALRASEPVQSHRAKRIEFFSV